MEELRLTVTDGPGTDESVAAQAHAMLYGGTCGATPAGSGWPVCCLEKGHEGEHESADFYWAVGDTEARPKP